MELGEHKFYKYENGRQIVWDTSSLSTFLDCAHLYKLKNLEGWARKAKSIAPVFGSAVHDGYEILDAGRFFGHDKTETVQKATKHILTKYGAELQKSDDNKRNLEAALRAIVWRADEYYHTDRMKIAELPNGEPALEVRFECPFPGTDYRFSGRVDKVVSLDGSLYVVDTKTTTSALSEWYFANFAPNNQVYTYIWAIRHVLELPIAGFIIDATTSGVNYTRFGRRPENVTESQVDEWLADTQLALKHCDEYHATGHWPRNFQSCGRYGGCEFRDACRVSQEHRQAFMEADFELKPYGDRK